MNNLQPKKEDVKAFFAGHYADFYSRFVEIKKSLGKMHRSLCPFHDETNPSFSIDNDSGHFHCYGCKADGDIFTFYGKIKGIESFPEILQGISEEFGISSGPSTKKTKSKKYKIAEKYSYHDESGEVLYQVCRTDRKEFPQRRPDGKGGWIWNMEGVRRVLYGLPEVLQAEGWILFLEGEKDVHNVRRLGFTATTSPGGAGKWRPEFSESLKGKDVILIPDNDEPGRSHMEDVAKSLQGMAQSVKVVELPGLPDKGDASDWINAGGTKDDLLRLIDEATEWEPAEDPAIEVKRDFPRRSFPWEILPESISRSFQQLARSCASSPTSLPGVAVAIFSSVIGSTVSVSPKKSWEEPLIFWFGDIRPTGTGKTPQARSLCNVLYEMQSQADENYKRELGLWESRNKKDRGNPPPRPRGYFVTNLTLEGLRADHSGHGGKVCILDELSSFISSQNEYKSKGSDRESWLCLHDGKPARIVRAKEAFTISGSRVSITGGIQPRVWFKSFTDEGGLYLEDGTVYRILPTYEGEAFFPLTSEAWSDENRESWESLLREAIKWADREHEEGRKRILSLSQKAQEIFFNWRNDLTMRRDDLPVYARGFVPKLAGYALRWSGALYLMECFVRGESPGSVLDEPDIEKGIKVSEFYLGHILLAMEALSGEPPEVVEHTDQVIHLAETLRSLEGDIDNGMLAIGYIREKYNASCDRSLRVRSPHLMGSILRRCGLTTTAGRHTANGKAGVFCLVWDKKTISFLENCPSYPSNPQAIENKGFSKMDNSNPKSKLSINREDQNKDPWTTWITGERSPSAESLTGKGSKDNLDNLNNFLREKEYAEVERDGIKQF